MDFKDEYKGNESLERDNFTGENHEGDMANTPVRFLTCSSIIGDKVTNTSGEDLGKIKDVMLDMREGKIEYVVVDFGGFLGFGDKYFAIPFEKLSLDAENKRFLLDYSKETFENAPGFNKDHWPETNKHYDKVNNYWGDFMGPNKGSEPYN